MKEHKARKAPVGGEGTAKPTGAEIESPAGEDHLEHILARRQESLRGRSEGPDPADRERIEAEVPRQPLR